MLDKANFSTYNMVEPQQPNTGALDAVRLRLEGNALPGPFNLIRVMPA